MNIEREKLRQVLECVRPGLASKDVVEQASCFVFRGGKVITYNDDVACRMPIPLDPEMTCAVPSAELLSMLEKFQEETLEISVAENRMLFKGKHRGFHLNIESDIHLPVNQVEKPDTWRKLPNDFLLAVSRVQACAGKDESKWANTCIHVHPEWIEATDNFQQARYKMKTGFETPILILRNSLRHVVAWGATKVCETAGWVHFKNVDGGIISVRRFEDTSEFPDITDLLVVKGVRTQFPKGLAQAALNAEEFSKANEDDNYIRVNIKRRGTAGLLRLTGDGVRGGYWEERKLKDYKGKSIEFLLAPSLLAQLTEKYKDYLLDGNERIIVKDGGAVYVICLCQLEGAAVAAEEEPAEEGEDEDEEAAE